ncbi:Uncharacterized protein dnm_020210 [Desulfonema magnum]|uniref:Uncharacterized protein n=1 Tax=Desulfonema magnum TaxID=45655 RepID=A0A975BIK2_9BACT|nr:Uncharacterized protein dnm_020210 [Desulfonema magnum]
MGNYSRLPLFSLQGFCIRSNVGWVERSGTHRNSKNGGFRFAPPTLQKIVTAQVEKLSGSDRYFLKTSEMGEYAK